MNLQVSRRPNAFFFLLFFSLFRGEGISAEDDADDLNRFGNSRNLTLLSPFTFFFVGDGDLLHPYSLEIHEDRSSLLGNQISYPVLQRIIAGINLRVLQGLSNGFDAFVMRFTGE